NQVISPIRLRTSSLPASRSPPCQRSSSSRSGWLTARGYTGAAGPPAGWRRRPHRRYRAAMPPGPGDRRGEEERSTMKVTAAVAHAAGQPLTIEEIELAGPRSGQVLIEIKATGVCHTDAYTLSGADPEGLFPA